LANIRVYITETVVSVPKRQSITLYISVVSSSNPVGFCVCSFTNWDLEVQIHGVANVSIRGLFIGFSIPFNGQLQSFDFVFEHNDC